MQLFLSLLVLLSLHTFVSQPFEAKYIILLIGDGYGFNQQHAVNAYTGYVPEYQTWQHYWVSTYSYGGSYNPSLAWSDFDYVKQNPTDSAAAATAIYSGVKTNNAGVNISNEGACLTNMPMKPKY
jgi:alkaline phosphatase